MKLSTTRSTRWVTAGLATAAALAACALVVRRQTAKAEAAYPPRGRFIMVDGVRLHFTVRGRDDAEQTLVLLHGEGSMADEFDISGLSEQAAQRYRVIAFDRPGYGWSEHPGGRHYSPKDQAALFHAALSRLGVLRPIVLGHSWGALVAAAMALDKPQAVSALVLVSGYYYPSVRASVPWLSLRAVPVLGTLLRHTVSPLIARATWPLMVRRLFWPAPVPQAFKDRYPLGLAMRPSQLHASAVEAAWMIPSAMSLSKRYADLQVPTVVVTGASDLMLWAPWHSQRLAERIERGWLRVVEGAGHMVHHVATGQVLAAVDQASAMARDVQQRWPTGLKGGEEPKPSQAEPAGQPGTSTPELGSLSPSFPP